MILFDTSDSSLIGLYFGLYVDRERRRRKNRRRKKKGCENESKFFINRISTLKNAMEALIGRF